MALFLITTGLDLTLELALWLAGKTLSLSWRGFRGGYHYLRGTETEEEIRQKTVEEQLEALRQQQQHLIELMELKQTPNEDKTATNREEEEELVTDL